MKKIPTEIFPASFVCLALNDQIFIYSISKSSAGPVSFRWAGLPTGSLQALCVCEEQASGVSVLLLFFRVMGSALSFRLCRLWRHWMG